MARTSIGRTSDVVLITGSSGFIGRALAARLARRFTVIGLDAVVPPEPAPAREAVRIDLTSDRSVRDALEHVRTTYGSRIAAVIHLAAYYDLSGEPSPKYEAVTVRGTDRLLQALRTFTVERFIFASTLLVHAPSEPGQAIDEEWPIEPKWPYPQSKVKTERLLRNRRGTMPVAILRLAGIYDDQCRAAFLAQQIARIYERQAIGHLYSGDVTHGQPYLHLDDLTEAIDRLIERRTRLPDELTLLLGEPETSSYQELQDRIGRLLHGEAWTTQEVPKPVARAGAWVQGEVLDEDPFIKPWMISVADDHYELDIGRAEALLGWRPRRALRDTLPVMIRALKADPPAWYRVNKLDAAKVAAADLEALRAEPRTDDESAGTTGAYEALAAVEHRRTLWAHYANMALGLWLATSPFVLGLFDAAAVAGLPPPPAAGHPLPPADVRNALLGWSDIVSGAVVVALAILSLDRRRGWAPWANAVTGAWLLFAPLAFWAPSAAAYVNDTLVGSFVIAFAVLVPEPRGISAEAMLSPSDMPRGWTYSPSTHLQRVPIVALAFLGLVISRYLTAYQLGHIDRVWDPLFGDGTATVVTSDVSKAWPVADAGVGALTYVLEILSGIMGDRRRWRTMPWLVGAFGLLIVPLGGVSILFIIIQPIVIGTYCGLCLLAAAGMVLMIPYSLDELVATAQFLMRSRRAGRPFWRTFFRGGSLPGDGTHRGPDIDAPLPVVVREFVTGGVTFPWTLLAGAALGLWLMLSRLVLGTTDAMANGDHLVGCLVVTVAFTAMADVARPVRFLNVPLGAWLVLAPFVLSGAGSASLVSSVAVGVALILISLPRGRLSGAHYGGWDRAMI